MSDVLPDPPQLDPATLSSTSFTRSRKGFEPVEVRALLERAADAMRQWARRDDLLVAAVAEAEERVRRAEDLDEEKVAEVLGVETARIVTTARSAAAEIRARAEEESARLRTETEAAACSAADALVAEATAERDRAASARVSAETQAAEIVGRATAEAERTISEATASAETTTTTATEQAEATRARAQEEADSLREDAQRGHDEMLSAAASVLAERTAEAEEAATALRREAEAERAAAREEAEQLRQEALAAAARELEAARAEGREMVAEARAVRQRMLRDFAERRRGVRQQLEAARVAREGIVEAIRTAAVRLDDTLGELEESEEDVRRASDKAADAVLDDVDRVVSELEARLESDAAGAPVEDASAVEEIPVADAADDAVPSAEHAVVGDVGAADFDEMTGTQPAGEPDEPGDTVTGDTDTGDTDTGDTDTGDTDTGDTDTGDTDTAAGGGGTEPGSARQLASVHDLFERLRTAEEPEADTGAAAPDGTAAAAQAAAAQTATATLTVSAEDAIDLTGSEQPGPQAGTGPAGLDTPADESLLDRRDELLAPAERLLSRNLKRLVGDEQNEVLDRARRLRRGRVELADLLPEAAETSASEHFTSALSDPFMLACAAGARLWCDLTSDQEPELDADSVGDVLSTRVTELLELRSLHLRGVIEQIDESGEDLGVLVDHLRAAYRELRNTSVPDLAADLASSGFNVGARAAAPGDAKWRWVPDNGGLPCSDAEDNALAGALPCGAEFPTGDVLPPAHPGCRCILVPAP